MEVGPVIVTMMFFFCSILLPSAAMKRDGHHLHVGFYSKTCPQAEQIVADVVYRAVDKNSSLAAGLIRLHFHDCFVNGCDASLLLDLTPSGEPVEKESPFNFGTLRGLEVIDEAKAQLEQECPGIVSCADTLAFAAREAVIQSGLPYYLVPAGRRDGRSSRAATIPGNLPAPNTSVKNMTQMFVTKGLTQEEMVILLGAHSIGVAHCFTFSYRLHNFSSTHNQDPSLDMFYAFYLNWLCPKPGTLSAEERSRVVAVEFDSLSPHKLDTTFYNKVLQGRGLLQSDQALARDPKTSEIVKRMAFNPLEWSSKFGKAMIRMGRVDALTGRKGEIRKHCRSIN